MTAMPPEAPSYLPEPGLAQPVVPQQSVVYATDQPIAYAPQGMPPQPVVYRAAQDRGVWVWPLIVLLSLAAIGGAVGLFLHNLHAETEIETGQCFTNLSTITGNNVSSLLQHRVLCSQPHEGEVIAVINPPAGLLAEEIGDWPNETCGFRFEDYVGLPVDRSELTLSAFPVFTTANDIAGDDALRNALDSGDWKLVCMVQTGDTRTGTVRNARR